MTDGRLAGRVAIITGGSRGMGASHARVMVNEGASVLITDILEEEGRRLADELGEGVQFQRHDVRRSEDWEKAVAAAEAAFGNVDILVNNAGVLIYAPLEATSEAEYRRMVDINQVGCFLGMKAVLPSMQRAGGGSIINVSSVAGLTAEPNTLAYAASKFAVTGMTKAAAKELGPRGIRVNSVHPGIIDTPMQEEVMTEESNAHRDVVLSAMPLGRLGRPEDVTSVVLFLASNDASYVTGSAYVVDGGCLC